MNDEQWSSRSFFESFWGFALLLVIVIGVWFAYWHWVQRQFYVPDDVAAFGDMFGAISALFSGAALAGIVYAIILQRRELKATRRELTRSASAHTQQAAQMELASKLNYLTTLIELYDRQLRAATGEEEQYIRAKKGSCETLLEDYFSDVDAKTKTEFEEITRARRRRLRIEAIRERLSSTERIGLGLLVNSIHNFIQENGGYEKSWCIGIARSPKETLEGIDLDSNADAFAGEIAHADQALVAKDHFVSHHGFVSVGSEDLGERGGIYVFRCDEAGTIDERHDEVA